MVADGLEGVGQAREHALAVVVDHGRLAVSDFAGPVNGRAVRVADALVPQAHAQDRQLGTEMPDHVVGDTGLARRAGARRHHDALGLHRLYVLYGCLIVADDLNLRAQFTQVLVEVVGETVVVVDEEKH